MKHQTDIFAREWCDIVFSSRNKSYGAYLLRKEYPANLLVAVFLSVGLLMALTGMSLIRHEAPLHDVPDEKGRDIIDLYFPEISTSLPGKEKLPPASKPAPAPQFSVPVVVKDAVENTVPAQGPIEAPAQMNVQGNNNGLTTSDPGLAAGGTEKIYNMAELAQMPSFPGGEAALYQFLSSNIRYPQLAKEAGIGGMVTIIFVISKSGKVEEIQLMRGIGGGCDEEAIRVIRSMPAWLPGKHNGQDVAVRMVIPIRFTLK